MGRPKGSTNKSKGNLLLTPRASKKAFKVAKTTAPRKTRTPKHPDAVSIHQYELHLVVGGQKFIKPFGSNETERDRQYELAKKHPEVTSVEKGEA